MLGALYSHGTYQGHDLAAHSRPKYPAFGEPVLELPSPEFRLGGLRVQSLRNAKERVVLEPRSGPRYELYIRNLVGPTKYVYILYVCTYSFLCICVLVHLSRVPVENPMSMLKSGPSIHNTDCSSHLTQGYGALPLFRSFCCETATCLLLLISNLILALLRQIWVEHPASSSHNIVYVPNTQQEICSLEAGSACRCESALQRRMKLLSFFLDLEEVLLR